MRNMKILEIDEEKRKIIEINMAVALLEELYNKGEINKKTFEGIKKDATDNLNMVY